MKRALLVVVGLLPFGAARLPFERELHREYRTAGLLELELDRDVREQAGQMGFVAALSGFRSVVADQLWLEVFTAFQETAWGRQKMLLEAVTRLQPRNVMFWDLAAWHMAWNASVNVLEDRHQREAVRMKAANEYIRLGESFAIRGTQFNPDRAKVWERLGDLYAIKLNDHCKAAAAYEEAAKRPDVMGYVYRESLYQLGQCPGHDEETLRKARALYDKGPMQRTPSLLLLIDKLQKKLNLPQSERVDISKDWEEAQPHVRKKQ